MVAFIPGYGGGTAADFHRIPISLRIHRMIKNSIHGLFQNSLSFKKADKIEYSIDRFIMSIPGEGTTCTLIM